jgi:hypothetical protein
MHVAFVAAIARQDQADKPRIAISLRLLSGFGRHELPVGIARRQVASKGPDVSNISYLFWISVDHSPGLIASHGDDLRYEQNRDLRYAIAQLHRRDVGFLDRYKSAFCPRTLRSFRKMTIASATKMMM